jgi:hypothetical protein
LLWSRVYTLSHTQVLLFFIADYDGGDISTFLGDASREINGTIIELFGGHTGQSGVFRSRGTISGTVVAGEYAQVVNKSSGSIFDLKNISGFPVAHEYRGASFSVLVCVSY